MGFKILLATLSVVACVLAQTEFYRVCLPSSHTQACQSLDKDGSRVVCEPVESRIDCALKLVRGDAHLGLFSEEELLLMGQQQPNDHRMVASIRDVSRQDPYAFEAVAVVPSSLTGGLEGLRGSRYCHPGMDEGVRRWSPRVLRTLEQKAARTDRCNEHEARDRTAEEMEVQELAHFFSAGCRPGPWSSNSTIDQNLKRTFPSLCSLCGDTNATCAGYTFDMGVTVSGVDNNNRHIQALQCLTRNSSAANTAVGGSAVAFVAWQHVREFFTFRSTALATSYAVLCEDGSLRTLTADVLANVTAPCSLVKQPWAGLVANTARSAAILADLKTWWPNGVNPGGNTWQATLYDLLVGGTALRAVFLDDLPTPRNYTSVRALPEASSTTACMTSQRWCTTSAAENHKCSWVSRASYTLGLEPAISCQQRRNNFNCLEEIRDNRADFISLDSNYGYLARAHYSLSPVKLLQNSRSSATALSRVAALVKETSAQGSITRFENLRGKKACFPEFGGIAYVTFLRAAHERSVISPTECDYGKAAAEFFDGACAPGAVDAHHALKLDSSYNASSLCSLCKPAPSTVNVGNWSDFTCAWDYSNMYFGTNGSLACLADVNTDVAFLEIQNIDTHLRALNLQANQFRVLCRNNTLAATTGVAVDDNCLLSLVVDAEVLARRSDPNFNSLSSLLDLLDYYFGYNAATGTQLINVEIYSPFDAHMDLLFKDSAIGLAEPSSATSHEPARNYFELFSHLESCTSGATLAGHSRASVYSFVTLAATVMSLWLL